ncbi:DUF3999 domain-containing protein [Pseudoduganella ginsengisoli]|uniref:DUF3999 family protein n=1 Tax=Pseudoduganella ginsengisoli TaxID=1462440 RepID=A0A6L6Q034_9BURK|nr:DUF3999 family protein [Pseudoduganella ginsengisoli]MTW02769.1 DUF3999 family protein [Pseudoduganella ginsengisoli]
MKRRTLMAFGCAVLLAAPWPARAGSALYADTPSAYAWSIPVSVADDNGVHALRMPAAVYLHAQSAGLADVRLFDRRGLPVPYALRQPPTDTYTDARELPLRIFPLYRQEGARASVNTGGDFKLELRTDSDGRLLSVTSGGPPPRPQAPASQVETLVLDLGVASRATPPTVTALRFTPPAGKPGYTAQVWLEASDDLRNWRPLGAADLQWLSATDGAVLACDLLTFEPSQFRYARLTWRSGTPAIFAGITALSFNRRQMAPAMDSAVLAPAAGRVPGDLVYAAGIGIPAERVGMQFSTPNAVYAAMLGRYREAAPPAPYQPAPQPIRHHHLHGHLHLHRHYREDPGVAAPPDPATADPFIPMTSATFYDITQDGKRKRSDGLPLAPTQLAQWVARPYSPQAAALPLSQAPKLQLSWTPATLLFLANGNGPYTLSYGRAGAPGMEHDLGHIAPGYSEKELRALPQAEAGPARPAIAAPAASLPAAAPASSAPGTATPPRSPGGKAANAAGKIVNLSDNGLLWGVLLAGVGALAYLTVRLLKQPGANGS